MLYKTCTIDGVETQSAWGLALSSRTISMPVARTEVYEIAGLHGEIDVTEAASGYPAYDPITIELNFGVIDREKWSIPATRKSAFSVLCGRVCKLIFGDDASYYYEGRMQIASFTPDAIIPKITVQMRAYPFKRSVMASTQSFTLGSGNLFDPEQITIQEHTCEFAYATTLFNTARINMGGDAGAYAIFIHPITNGASYIFSYRQFSGTSATVTLSTDSMENISPGVPFVGGRYGNLYIRIELNARGIINFTDLILTEAVGITLNNGASVVWPRITASVECAGIINGTTVLFPEGVSTSLDFALQPGKNRVTFCSGETGTVALEWTKEELPFSSSDTVSSAQNST